MNLTEQNLDHALGLVGELLASWGEEGYQLVVCGGSALLAGNIGSRSTRDVDVLARKNWEQEICRAHPLPAPLARAAAKVAVELGLATNWLNSSASMHFPDFHALPNTFWTDMETREYGDCLRVSFVNRSGQILLKFYAALNRNEFRDLEDLQALAPDAAETEAGLRWLLDSIPGLTHRARLPDLLTALDHASLKPRFEE